MLNETGQRPGRWRARRILAAAAVVLCSTEALNLARNVAAGAVYWVERNEIVVSRTGGLTTRRIRVPDGEGIGIGEAGLLWLAHWPEEEIRLVQPGGQLRRYGLSTMQGRYGLSSLNRVRPAGARFWLHGTVGIGSGRPCRGAMFIMDPAASTYRFLPGIVDASSDTHDRVRVLLAEDGHVDVQGAASWRLQFPAYRIAGMTGDLDAGYLRVGLRTRGPLPDDGPTYYLVDLASRTAEQVPSRILPLVDPGAGEWWAEPGPLDLPWHVVYDDPAMRVRRRRVWTVLGLMFGPVGHVDQRTAHLFDLLDAIRPEDISRAEYSQLVEAPDLALKPQPAR